MAVNFIIVWILGQYGQFFLNFIYSNSIHVQIVIQKAKWFKRIRRQNADPGPTNSQTGKIFLFKLVV